MAGLMGLGGAMGYARAKSLPSLAAGLISSSLFAYSGVLINQGKDFEGHALSLTVSSVLTVAMSARVLRTRKIMPAGIIAGICLASSVYNANKVVEWS